MAGVSAVAIGVDEAVYLLKPPNGDWPQIILAGPRTADPAVLEQEFIKERDGNIYVLDNRRFSNESFATFVDWLTAHRGFRSVEWCTWFV